VSEAISEQESDGDYRAKGKILKSGDRAYGKYQIMGRNVPSWTKEALGRSLTPEEFLEDTEAQDLTARYKVHNLLSKYSEEQVAAIWLSGKPYLTSKQDANGMSVIRYAKAVMYHIEEKGR
jgi:hypothetical protein